MTRRGWVACVIGTAGVVIAAVFLASPFWSMAGLARAVCAGDDTALEGYIDRARMNRLELGALKLFGRRACPSNRPWPIESSRCRTAANMYRRTEVEWVTSRTIKVTFLRETGDGLASGILEREGLRWRIVDIGIER